jgi:hypothetical protein
MENASASETRALGQGSEMRALWQGSETWKQSGEGNENATSEVMHCDEANGSASQIGHDRRHRHHLPSNHQ